MKSLRNYTTAVRDASFALVLNAVFSLLPPMAGVFFLWLFGKWDKDWFHILASGELLVASACLTASSIFLLGKVSSAKSFLRSGFNVIASIVIAFDSLIYAGIALKNENLLAPGANMVPKIFIGSSVILYLAALFIGFYALVTDHPAYPSNLAVQKQQVATLDEQLDKLQAQ